MCGMVNGWDRSTCSYWDSNISYFFLENLVLRVLEIREIASKWKLVPLEYKIIKDFHFFLDIIFMFCDGVETRHHFC